MDQSIILILIFRDHEIDIPSVDRLWIVPEHLDHSFKIDVFQTVKLPVPVMNQEKNAVSNQPKLSRLVPENRSFTNGFGRFVLFLDSAFQIVHFMPGVDHGSRGTRGGIRRLLGKKHKMRRQHESESEGQISFFFRHLLLGIFEENHETQKDYPATDPDRNRKRKRWDLDVGAGERVHAVFGGQCRVIRLAGKEQCGVLRQHDTLNDEKLNSKKQQN